MGELAKAGAGVLMVSSEMPELLGVADRIYAMKDGEITGEVSRKESGFTQENILSFALEGRSCNGAN